MRPARLALAVLSIGFVASGAPETETQVQTRTETRIENGAAVEVVPPAPAEAAWLVRAQQGLAAREYRASESGAGLQAPNRAHNLRTWFEPAGIRVHDRTAGGSPELLRLALARVGRGEQVPAVAPGEAVVADESRVEIRRPGLVEWYVNSPAGLEQGFTLAERPAGEGELVLELAVAGAMPRLRGDAIAFATQAASDSARPGLAARPSGLRQLRYGALAAADAAGRALAARFELPAPERLRIVVDDAGASYPLVIDPLLTETADTQLASDQPDARLGFSVAGAGDVNGDGWADVIVGAPYYDAGEADEGAAFVFLGSATGIADATPASAAAQLESDQPDAWLGTSVAGAGDVNGDGYADVIVSAPRYDAGEADEGAAFVFHGSATGLADGTPASAAAQLESDQAGAWLGIGVAGAGDVNGDGYADVIVGAWSYADPDPGEGAAFVFHGSASGVADGTPASAAATLESDQAGAQLGVRVAGAGDVNGDGYGDVIVGAWAYAAPELGEGAAFVFQGSATGLADGTPASAAAQLESDQAGAQLGASVAGAGDVNGDGYSDVIVGAPAYDAGQGAGEGAAFVFHGSATGLTDGSPASAAAQLESDQAGSQLGFSVAGAGDVDGDGYADVVVGALFYGAGEAGEGAAFVFTGSGAGIADGNPATALAQLEADQPDAALGISVAGAGDVNGDGYADVIAGAAFADDGQPDEGMASIYLGGGSGIPDGDPTAAAARLESNRAGVWFGSGVERAGDVNGDGYADVLVAAARWFPNFLGATFVFHGSASGIAGDPSTAATRIDGAYGAGLGAGDLNADGYSDVTVPYLFGGVFFGSASGIASEPTADDGDLIVRAAGDVNGDGYADLFGGGAAYHGSASGIADWDPSDSSLYTPVSQLQYDSDPDPSHGASTAPAGDVNGDGYADVIMGAEFHSTPGYFYGAAFVFHGSASGIPSGGVATATTRLVGYAGATHFGRQVAGAGDVNGDGYADVLVRTHAKTFIFHGSATGIADGDATTAATQLDGGVYTDLAAPAGDVNGDGYADVTIRGSAATSLFHGSATGIADGNAAAGDTLFVSVAGSRVTAVGDVNGDGSDDLIVGDPLFDGGETDEGAVYVYLGNGGGDSRPAVLQQLRAAVDVPIQPWGRAISQTSFRVRMQATHPEGRGRVKLAVEYCPPGVGFGHASCGSQIGASWTDVGATSGGVALTETVGGLTANTPYRWRARVLRAPFRVTEAGITAPPSPAHGPWRRLSARTTGTDVRTMLSDCSDGFDNDRDGETDFDPACNALVNPVGDCGCTSLSEASERDASYPCDDGLDSDFDGRFDFDPATRAGAPDFSAGFGDPGCESPTWLREDPQCQDGASNDPSQDPQGLKDFDGGQSLYGACSGGSCPPGVSDVGGDGVADPDPQCVGQPWKNREKVKTGCGLGFELALWLPALAALRRRGRLRGSPGGRR